MVRPAVQAAKRLLLPEAGPRRLPLGIGRGLRLDIDFQSQTRIYLGLYEIELNRHLRRLCRPGTRSFDVGGAFGYDALVLARLTGHSVVTFEPDPHECGRMRRNLALNPEGSLVRLEPVAVGAPGSAATLDDYADGAGGHTFVKIDVDGGEADVLRGAGALLRHARPALIVETHSPELEQECGRLLCDHGYRPTIVHQRSVWQERRPIDHNRWLVAAP